MRGVMRGCVFRAAVRVFIARRCVFCRCLHARNQSRNERNKPIVCEEKLV